MCSKFVILFCCISAVLAYPYETTEEVVFAPSSEVVQLVTYPEKQVAARPHRVRLKFDLSGTGSTGRGFDINANAHAPVWTSENGRHSIEATAGYLQHLGGPNGNSPADIRGGGSYTFSW